MALSYTCTCHCVVSRSPHHEEYLQRYLDTQSIKETHQLSKELGEDIHYKSFQTHLKDHVDLRTDAEKKLDDVRGYAIAWAKENESLIKMLSSYSHILQHFKNDMEHKLETGEMIKDFPKIARELRAILKDLQELQDTLAESPLVSRDCMYQVFLTKLDVLCKPCGIALLESFEEDLRQLTGNTQPHTTLHP